MYYLPHIIVIILGSIFILYLIWMYLRTKVPIVTTSKREIQNLLKGLDKKYINKKTVVYELGSAFGTFCFEAEKLNPKKIMGYELSPLHILYCRLKARLRKSKAKFICEDFFEADISNANVIYVFLVPHIVDKLWKKIKKECSPGTIMILRGNKMQAGKIVQKIKKNPKDPKNRYFHVYQV